MASYRGFLVAYDNQVTETEVGLYENIFSDKFHEVQWTGSDHLETNISEGIRASVSAGKYAIRFNTGDASCRETLISYFKKVQTILLSKHPRYARTTFFVHVSEENQSYIKDATSPYAVKALELAGFLKNAFSPNYGMQFLGDKFVVSSKRIQDTSTSVYALSLILLVLRKEHLVTPLINYIKEGGIPTTKGTFLLLSRIFLENYDISIGSSKPLFLSIFCYGMHKGIKFPDGWNGPSNAGKFVYLETYMQYIRDVFLKIFPEGKPSSWLGLMGDGTKSSEWGISFRDLTDLIYSRDFKPKEQAEKTIEQEAMADQILSTVNVVEF